MPSTRKSLSDSLEMQEIEHERSPHVRAINAISWFDKFNKNERVGRQDITKRNANNTALMKNKKLNEKNNKSELQHSYYYLEEEEEEELENERSSGVLNSNEATSMITPSVTATREFATPSRVIESTSSIKDETTLTRLASVVSPIHPTCDTSHNTYQNEFEKLPHHNNYHYYNNNNIKDDKSYYSSSEYYQTEYEESDHATYHITRGQSSTQLEKSNSNRNRNNGTRHNQETNERQYREYGSMTSAGKKHDSSKTSELVLYNRKEEEQQQPNIESNEEFHNSTNYSSALLQDISQREAISAIGEDNATFRTTCGTHELLYDPHHDRAVDMYDNAMRIRVARERWLSVERARRDQVQTLRERQECTFQPRLSPYARKLRRPRNLRPEQRSSAEVLYRQLRHALMQRAEAERELAECTFRPLTLRRAKLHVGITPETAEERKKEQINKNGKNEDNNDDDDINVFENLYIEAKTRQHFQEVIRPQIVQELQRRMTNRATGGGVVVPMPESRVQEVVNRLFTGTTMTNDKRQEGHFNVSAVNAIVVATKESAKESTMSSSKLPNKSKKMTAATIPKKPRVAIPYKQIMEHKQFTVPKTPIQEDEQELYHQQEEERESEWEELLEEEEEEEEEEENKKLEHTKKKTIVEKEEEQEWHVKSELLELELKTLAEKERKRLEQESLSLAQAKERETLHMEWMRSILISKFEALAFAVAQNTHRPFRRHDRYPVIEIAKVALQVLAADEAEEVLIILENCNLSSINVREFVRHVFKYVKNHTVKTDYRGIINNNNNKNDININNGISGSSSNSSSGGNNTTQILNKTKHEGLKEMKKEWLLLSRAPPLDPETHRRASSARQFVNQLAQRERDSIPQRPPSLPHTKRVEISPAELERIRAKHHAERVMWEEALKHRRAVERGEAIDATYTFQPARTKRIPYECRPDVIIPIKETKSQQLRRAKAQERQGNIAQSNGCIMTQLKHVTDTAKKSSQRNEEYTAYNRSSSRQRKSITPETVSALVTDEPKSTARMLFGTEHRHVNDEHDYKHKNDNNGATGVAEGKDEQYDYSHNKHALLPLSSSPVPAHANKLNTAQLFHEQDAKMETRTSFSDKRVDEEHMLETQPATLEHMTESMSRKTTQMGDLFSEGVNEGEDKRQEQEQEQEEEQECKSNHERAWRHSQTSSQNRTSRRTSSLTSYAAMLAKPHYDNKAFGIHTSTKENDGASAAPLIMTHTTHVNEAINTSNTKSKRHSRQECHEIEEELAEKLSPRARNTEIAANEKNTLTLDKGKKRLERQQKEALMQFYHNAITKGTPLHNKMTLSKLGRELLLKQLLEFQQSRRSKRYQW